MGLTDFTPETQDLIAVSMLQGLGVIDKIKDGDIEAGVSQASKQWAALPEGRGKTGRHNQPNVEFERFEEAYKAAGGEQANMLPADVRYLAQWKSDCKNFGQCHGIEAYFRATKKKYARDPEVMRILNTYDTSVEVEPMPDR